MPYRSKDLVMKEYLFYRTLGWYLLHGLDYKIAEMLFNVHKRDGPPPQHEDLVRLGRIFYRFRCDYGEYGDNCWESTIRSFIPYSHATLRMENSSNAELVMALERHFLQFVRTQAFSAPIHSRHNLFMINDAVIEAGFTHEIEQECYNCRNFEGFTDYTAVGRAIRVAERTYDYARSLPVSALIQTNLLPCNKILPYPEGLKKSLVHNPKNPTPKTNT